MKKIFALLFVSTLSVSLMTGCGSKDETKKEKDSTIILSCESEEDKDKVDMYYKNDKLVKMEEELTLETKDEADAYVMLFNTYYNATATSNNNVVNIVLEGSDLEDFLADTTVDTSKSALKSALEASGYVCK